MYVGLSGMNANQARIDTIGNNIANVNTHGFKGSRTLFQTQFSRLISAGHGPTSTSGGVNPTQVGLGTIVGATQKNFNPGSIETTGIASDLAIEGDGLFILQKPDGQQVFTRDGSFTLDASSRLVSQDGYVVQGFGVDEDFNLLPTALTDLTIPLGTLTLARATSTVVMDGDLSAEGTVATQGSVHRTQDLVDASGSPATGGTSLTDLRAASDPTTPLFASGDTITVSGISKGDRTLPSATFVVGQDGTTLDDFAAWLEGVLGIQTGDGVPGDGGVSVENGALVIRSNPGEPNGFSISGNDILSTNSAVGVPFAFTQDQAANGSGVVTSFTVYDSLGTPVTVTATFTLEEKAASGPVWRYYLETTDSDGIPQVIGTGTVSFDAQGNFLSADGNQFSLDRTGTGAASPLQFTLDFSQVHGLSTRASSIVMQQQDGFPPGTLTDFSVASDGTINGTFSNGMTRPLGQVALAVFPNPGGLVAQADNLYVRGPNAGEPTVTPPGQFGAGTLLGGALELSNVDLAAEFIGLITSSTGFQASSRVIRTSSDLLEQLLLVVR